MLIRRAVPFLFGVVLGVMVQAVRAGRVALDKPIAISTLKADRKPLDGRLVAYDEDGFELARGKNKSITVRWSELGPPGLFNVRSAILRDKATGEQWLELGRKLLTIEGGAPFADRAFARAVKLDGRLAAKVEAFKRAKPEKANAGKSTATQDRDATAEMGPGAGATTGPHVVGRVDAATWGQLPEAQQAAQVKRLKAFAQSAAERLNKDLSLKETKYFLFYSDLPSDEAARWAGLLDRMYARLAELFGVPREARETAPAAAKEGRSTRTSTATNHINVWNGKALVFVFKTAGDYRQFQIRVHQTDPGTSAGMCHCFGDGKVHIAFYKQADELAFAHVLVHESVHGFLHRFRAPPNVPSWANEGLAEVIASELVPRPGRSTESESRARSGLQLRGGLSGMLDGRHIEAWQYPVAETLCAFMIRQSKPRYVDFIVGIKEGLTWEQSLEQRYGTRRDRLVRAYGESLGIKGLKE